MNTPAYLDLTTRQQRQHRLGHLLAIAQWDQAANMPPDGNEARSLALAEMDGLLHQLATAGGLEAAPELLARRDHLADRVAGAQAATELAEGPIRHPGHRRHEEPVREKVGAEVHEGLLKKEAGL